MEKADVETGLQPAGKGASLGDFAGDDVASKISVAVNSAPVVIFGKEHCPFCIEVRRLFRELGVQTLDFNVDTMPDGAAVWNVLKKQHSPQNTVPYVFVNKVMVGGCDATKRLQADGELAKMLRTAGIKIQTAPPTSIDARVARSGVLEGRQPAGGTLFHFPEVVDNRVVRLNGFWTFVICLLCAIFYKRQAAHWTMGGLMVEYVARLLGGSNVSALGSLSAVITALMDLLGSRPNFVAGPPKQFAALCGSMFSALAFFFFLVYKHEYKLINVGLAFTCALGAAALLESAINFCLGCWMFGLMIRFGLVSDTVYQTYINTKAEIEYTYTEMSKRLREGPPQVFVKHTCEQHPLSVDYKYKAKTDDMTREDFHPIKHTKLTHFVVHLGFVGLACAWRAADPAHSGLNLPAAVWYSLGIASAICYCMGVVLYLLKLVMYPRKVLKEIAHNVNGSCFALPWVILILFAYLVSERDPTFAKVLFWIGAPVSLFLSIVWVGGWVALKKELEHVNASWMLMPVGNFVAAAVGPLLDPAYRDAMQLWFAFALLFWAALFVITLYKAFVMPEYDDRARPMLAAWVAAPAIGAIAYMSCYLPSATVVAGLVKRLGEGFNDFIFINMYWMAMVAALVLLVCFIRPYFGRLRFDMSYWSAGFPSAALCMCAIYYNVLKPGDLSEAIAYTTLFVTSWLTAILWLQTFAAFLRFQVFTPDYKWGPMSYMRLSHEALRGLLPALQSNARDCGSGAAALSALRDTWSAVVLVHLEHGRHEDDVIFPIYDQFFPGVTADAHGQHDDLEAAAEKISGLLSEAGDSASGAGAAEIEAAVQQYSNLLSSHLRWEEDHLQAMPRKYIPLALSKEIIRKCWAATPVGTWQTLLPLMLESMPMLHQRVRFIKTLLWAMPERCHLFGIILARGVDAVNWRRITAELPEIVPRGATVFWERYY